MPDDDSTLLRRYAQDGSEAAFAEVVRRHVDLVYAVALRQVGGDAHLAEEVAQVVFAVLARKAGQLAARPVLGGWLYRTAQYTAIDVVRAESRRRARETEALHMQETTDSGGGVDWEKLRPALDRVIGELRDEDRDAVVLRFFEGRSFAEVGARLRLTENAARMRVDRALDKLGRALARRGVRSTTAALATALGQQAMAATPAGLAASVTGVALAGAVTTGASAGSAGGVMAFMSTMKLQLGIAGALVVAGTMGVVTQLEANAARRDELAALQAQLPAPAVVAQTQDENRKLAAALAEVELWRKDDAELARLREAVASLRERQTQAARAEAAAKARRAAELAAMPVYSAEQVDLAPVPRFQGAPAYPKAQRAANAPGEAEVSFVVNADGEPSEVQSVKYSHADFAEAAIAAVKQWRFEPGQKAGGAVNVRMKVPMKFTMETSPSAKPRVFWF